VSFLGTLSGLVFFLVKNSSQFIPKFGGMFFL
jgi:uncharacterized membrane protein